MAVYTKSCKWWIHKWRCFDCSHNQPFARFYCINKLPIIWMCYTECYFLYTCLIVSQRSSSIWSNFLKKIPSLERENDNLLKKHSFNQCFSSPTNIMLTRHLLPLINANDIYTQCIQSINTNTISRCIMSTMIFKKKKNKLCKSSLLEI